MSIDEILQKHKNVPFVKRILEKDTQFIDWNDGRKATHLLGTASDNIGPFVYPLISTLNDKIYQSHNPVEAALQNSDIIRFESDEAADNFTKNYKTSNSFQEYFNNLGNTNYVRGTNLKAPQYGSEEQFLDFVKRYETYKENPYFATGDEARKNIYTIGYGNRFSYDRNLNATPVSNKDQWSEKEARIQLQRHLQSDVIKLTKLFPNFNKWDKGVQYAVRDLIYNTGNIDKSTNLYRALNKYDSSNDFSNFSLIQDIAKHMDYNLNTPGNLGIRGGSRRAMVTSMYDWKDNDKINTYNRDRNNSTYYYMNSPYWQWGKSNPIVYEQKNKYNKNGGILNMIKI